MSKKLSIIIPVYNEEENVQQLHHELRELCSNQNYEAEIIFVNDGSSDKTAQRIAELSGVTCIEFRKNFGQTAAMDAGLKQAQGQYIITLDGDGQNDPADIPRLIQYLEEHQLDLVVGWRKNRKDTWLKHFVSRGANLLRKIILQDEIHDSGCSLKVFRQEAVHKLDLYGEMHRFIPALLQMRGFQVGELVVNHRPRRAGKTKYNWRRTIKGLIDMFSIAFWHRYAVRPLHLLGGIGMVFILLSIPSAMATLFSFLAGQGMSETAWPLLTVFFFLGGTQLFISGLLADMVMKNYYESGRQPSYHIRHIKST